MIFSKEQLERMPREKLIENFLSLQNELEQTQRNNDALRLQLKEQLQELINYQIENERISRSMTALYQDLETRYQKISSDNQAFREKIEKLEAENTLHKTNRFGCSS